MGRFIFLFAVSFVCLFLISVIFNDLLFYSQWGGLLVLSLVAAALIHALMKLSDRNKKLEERLTLLESRLERLQKKVK